MAACRSLHTANMCRNHVQCMVGTCGQTRELLAYEKYMVYMGVLSVIWQFDSIISNRLSCECLRTDCTEGLVRCSLTGSLIITHSQVCLQCVNKNTSGLCMVSGQFLMFMLFESIPCYWPLRYNNSIYFIYNNSVIKSLNKWSCTSMESQIKAFIQILNPCFGSSSINAGSYKSHDATE